MTGGIGAHEGVPARTQDHRVSVFIDYSVLDSLLRLDEGRYVGEHEAGLALLRLTAENHHVQVWISEITLVEMLHGRERAAVLGHGELRAASNDAAKMAI